MAHKIQVTDSKTGRTETITVPNVASAAVAKRIAKNQFAVKFGADPTRLRTKRTR